LPTHIDDCSRYLVWTWVLWRLHIWHRMHENAWRNYDET